MSDEPTQIRRQLPGEWWYFAGQLRAALDRKRGDPDMQWTSQPTSSGCIIHVGPHPLIMSVAHFLFVGKGDSTTLIVDIIGKLPDIQPLIDDLVEMAREARDARRGAIGETFKEILDDYYQRKARGEKPNLQEMARQAGANIGSLRQYKIRYDQARRKQDTSSD